MNTSRIVKTEFFVYLNKELYRTAHSWEEFQIVKEEIFTKYSGYSWIHGSNEIFSVYVNDKTKDAITYWYRMREITNLKDSQGNIVCVETNEDKPFVCNKCFFYNMLPLCPQCSATNRKDGRNVIFKEVEE